MSTKEKLVAAAEAEFLTHGYAATRVDEICARAGVSKGSFYHFFPTKEDVALAALDAFFLRNRKIIDAAPEAGTPRQRAIAVLEHILASARQMWGGGCLLGSLALDLAETHPRIAEQVSARFRAMVEMLAEAFAPLVRAGRPQTAESLAEEFVVSVEGGLVLATAQGDWGYVERALERFRRHALQLKE